MQKLRDSAVKTQSENWIKAHSIEVYVMKRMKLLILPVGPISLCVDKTLAPIRAATHQRPFSIDLGTVHGGSKHGMSPFQPEVG